MPSWHGFCNIIFNGTTYPQPDGKDGGTSAVFNLTIVRSLFNNVTGCLVSFNTTQGNTMETQHPLSVIEAFKVYAAAYRAAYGEINDNNPEQDKIVERYQAVKHHGYNARVAKLIGKCHGYQDS